MSCLGEGLQRLSPGKHFQGLAGDTAAKNALTLTRQHLTISQNLHVNASPNAKPRFFV